MSSCRLALMCALALAPWGAASAQDNHILSDLYGSGVHAFNGGNYQAAHADLTSVIERGSNDPRAYYFRAMAYLKLGRPEEAKADMEQGAKLESADVDGAYNVGRALERVQGSGRLMLEKHRLQARLEAHARQQQADRQKYEAVRSDEKRALRDRVEVPLDGGPVTVTRPSPADRAVKPAAAEEEVPAPRKQPTVAADPFGDEPADDKPADAPTGDDPFGEAPAEKPAPADDDPFGDAPADEPEMKKEDAPADDDPFGADAPADEAPVDEKPADDDPFATDGAGDEAEMKKEDAPADDDPFGADAPADEAPADEKPADDDPFAADAPAEDAPADEKPAEEDPFGADADEKPAAESADDNDDPFN